MVEQQILIQYPMYHSLSVHRKPLVENWTCDVGYNSVIVICRVTTLANNQSIRRSHEIDFRFSIVYRVNEMRMVICKGFYYYIST
ncbi:hypothetical protein AQUCO_00400684v1 [Aquilegia coerulea]|uniref:Uncharacterized protein n=1 Tax=Aquilegia coerulea TaxID=218851 RepID=A0A2G5EW49_AQUCA|nr:hypothetical protein AQUCO_00400684v1 [Aquilegia coerulea]